MNQIIEQALQPFIPQTPMTNRQAIKITFDLLGKEKQNSDVLTARAVLMRLSSEILDKEIENK